MISILAAMGAFYFFWPAKAADFDANNIINIFYVYQIYFFTRREVKTYFGVKETFFF